MFVLVEKHIENDIEILGKSAHSYMLDALKEANVFVSTSISKEAVKSSNEPILLIKGSLPLITKGAFCKLLLFYECSKFNIFKMSLNDESSSFLIALNYNVLEDIQEIEEDEITAELVLNRLYLNNLDIERIIITETKQLNDGSTPESYFELSAAIREKINFKHMLSGVKIIDPTQTYIDADVKIGKGTIVYPLSIVEGETEIGENCKIGPNSKITQAKIGNNVEISFSVLKDCIVGDETMVGPFAYIRPNSEIGQKCKIGDFVEVKNSKIGNGTKASHLTYIGDASVGSNVNFGCGTVVVNYDGKNKFKTTIEDDCFIGCNTNLVSPVVLKEGVFVAAGSTITNDVPKNSLAIARAKQINKENWERPKKNND